MLPNVSAFPVTWLAIATLGAVMIPVNGAYTPREVAYVTGDGEASWLVIDESYLPIFEAIEARPERLIDTRVVVLGRPRPGQKSWQDVLALGMSAPPVTECPAAAR
jgi:acyl-coenzyme A synthetase/AMP-(fatty) acid ligase